MPSGPIGILSLQGGVRAHRRHLEALGHTVREVRHPDELTDLAALVIPGGESTTLGLFIHSGGLPAAIREFAATRPVMGTCAGLILMANRLDDDRIRPLGLLDIAVQRNHYGTQMQSFVETVEAAGIGRLRATFIRAPAIRRVGPGVEILARHGTRPVLIRQGRHLGCCFHPELGSDTRVHAWWLGQEAACGPC